MIVYQCEDSMESIFTAIYLAYENKDDLSEVYLSLRDEPLLFAEERHVISDTEKARKVINTLLRKFGERDYMMLCLSLSSCDEEKAQAVFRTVQNGLEMNCAKDHLFDALANPYVLKTFSLARGASRELDHIRGFLRFSETKEGILYSKIGVKNNILTFMMPHFADRLQNENFVIYDDKRNLFGIHPKGRQWFLRFGESDEEPIISLSEEEKIYQELFRFFCNTIAIKERENSSLQKNMLPLRFQEYMVEFTNF